MISPAKALPAFPHGRAQRAGWLAAAGLLAIVASRSALAGDSVPSTAYYDTFNAYYDGDYQDALKSFRAEGRGAIKAGPNRWIDSICYHTMSGECYYQMGQYSQALEHYNNALNLFVTFSDWMIRGQFPATIRPSSTGREVPWGRSTRPSRLGVIPDQISIAQGAPGLQAVQPGVVTAAPPVLFPVHAKEIVRCTCQAMRRRRELLGPACQHDPLTPKLVAALARRPCTPNNWSESWIDIELGLAYACAGNDAQAGPLLERGTVVAGEFDHDLTALALVELGRIHLQQANFAAAAAAFEEASYSAFYYWDPGLLEEAFRYGLITHLVSNQKGLYPPLATAATWAKTKKLRQLQVSLLLLAAENYSVLGQGKEAAALLETARPLIGKRDLAQGRIGARWNYLSALNLYQQGKPEAGDEALAAALGFQSRGGSVWLFQIATADAMYTDKAVSDRTAMVLYAALLRDPTAADWVSDPLESLSVLSTPHPGPLEHWFEAALDRKEDEIALEIGDALKRHRFLSSLAMGGRLLSLRWQLEGPQDILSQQAIQERQDILARYDRFDQLSQQATQLRGELAQIPLVADDAGMKRDQQDKLARLAEVSLLQEALLREIAIRREPSSMVFPPRRKTQEIRDRLPENSAALVFVATSKRLHAFLISKQKYSGWQVGAPAGVQKQLTTLLRGMGQFESNSQLDLKQLAEGGWKKPARDILPALFKGAKGQFPADLEELVVVPDGLFWYVPFETLQVADGDGLRPLITKTRVRYAPTASLTVPDQPGRQGGNTAVVVGRLYPGADEALAQAACDELSQTLPGTVALPKTLPAPSAVYAALFDRLIVLDDFDPKTTGGYAWSPVPIDRGQPGSSLDHWLTLPWRGPDQVILPGFHTAAENSLKKQAVATAGADVFLPVCGLMACGARTILLSRWRTGGASSFDLVREFAQELPHTTADEAWQRSVLLARGQPLDPDHEPRLSVKSTEEPPTADHPFFWAGYLLVDTGAAAPDSQDAPPPQPGPAVARQPAPPQAAGAPPAEKPAEKPAAKPEKP